MTCPQVTCKVVEVQPDPPPPPAKTVVLEMPVETAAILMALLWRASWGADASRDHYNETHRALRNAGVYRAPLSPAELGLKD